jgi:hypothetical protein
MIRRCPKIGTTGLLLIPALALAGCSADATPRQTLTDLMAGPSVVAGLATAGIAFHMTRLLFLDIARERDARLPRAIESLFPLKGRWLRYLFAVLAVLVFVPFIFAGLTCLFTVLWVVGGALYIWFSSMAR